MSEKTHRVHFLRKNEEDKEKWLILELDGLAERRREREKGYVL